MAEVEVMHRDAKNLSQPKLDARLSQQKRREVLLESQRSRRDELLEKLRSLDESGASESEGEEVDFLEEMVIKKHVQKEDGVKYTNGKVAITSEGNAQEPVVVGRGSGRGRSACNGIIPCIPGVEVEGMEVVVQGRGRGRGRGPPQLSLSNADVDQNWRSQKKIEPPVPAPATETPKPENGYHKRNNNYHRKRPAPYGIMLSEWLVDVPEDFEENWLGVLCPVGRRCIVVASRGKTKVYTRRNDYLGQFTSCLPGGSQSLHYSVSGNRRRGTTILDCLWSDKAQMFYVLDLVCWNSHSVNNCPTDLRLFLLMSKFEETPELLETTVNNPVRFMPLPFFPADTLATVMTTTYPAFPDEIDGVLFYHKNVFYMPEVTPLVLWVHLSDMGTVLSVNVNPDLLARERVRNERTRYYLQKPKYERKKTPAVGAAQAIDEDEAEIQEVCDENGIPLG